MTLEKKVLVAKTAKMHNPQTKVDLVCHVASKLLTACSSGKHIKKVTIEM